MQAATPQTEQHWPGQQEEKQEYLAREMLTCGSQEKCLAGIAMQRELDDEVRVAPFVSVLNTNHDLAGRQSQYF